jgi:Tol biopolymer transport system component
MTDQELEQRLHAWYAAEVGETETAPDDLRQVLATIPATTPAPLRARGGRRGFTLLAVAAVLIVGGVLAAGSGVISPRPVVTPVPNVAVAIPSGSTSLATPAPNPNVGLGTSIAFIRTVDKTGKCAGETTCPTPRLWIVGSDGQGAHEMFPDGVTFQGGPAWSPDGSRLLYSDDKSYLTDASGSAPQPVDTGCAAPCLRDSQFAFSNDGKRLVFIRESTDASGYAGPAAIATMDLASGHVAELQSTSSDVSAAPGWSLDGTQIVFFRFGEKDGGGPVPPRLDAIWIVSADGTGLRQLSPTTLPSAYPKWSPDGARIVFESRNGEGQDIYTIRPDGTDVRRMTTDGASTSATWTPDGRILFVRTGGASPGWWTMGADGADAGKFMAELKKYLENWSEDIG